MFQSLLSISASSLKHSFYICQRKRFFLPSLKINSRLRQNHVAHVVKYQELENTAISIYSVWIYHLTNGPQFSMVYTLIDHRNDVIKCSKLKWNHEPQASGFTAKFWTFYGVISMVYKSVDHGKLWSICFLQQHLFFLRKNKKNKTTGSAWHVTSFPWSILSYTIALDQSARQDSLSYCNFYYRS